MNHQLKGLGTKLKVIENWSERQLNKDEEQKRKIRDGSGHFRIWEQPFVGLVRRDDRLSYLFFLFLFCFLSKSFLTRSKISFDFTSNLWRYEKKKIILAFFHLFFFQFQHFITFILDFYIYFFIIEYRQLKWTKWWKLTIEKI